MSGPYDIDNVGIFDKDDLVAVLKKIHENLDGDGCKFATVLELGRKFYFLL